MYPDKKGDKIKVSISLDIFAQVASVILLKHRYPATPSLCITLHQIWTHC